MTAIPHDLDFAALAAWGRERVPNARFWTVHGATGGGVAFLRGCPVRFRHLRRHLPHVR